LARAALDLSIFRYHLEDEFARKLVADIKRTDIGKLLDRIARDSGPIGSNNVIILSNILSNRVLNWGIDEGLIEFNPGARLRKAGQPRPRERVLSTDEIRKLWWALAAPLTPLAVHEFERALSVNRRSCNFVFPILQFQQICRSLPAR
jgi:integrase